MNFLTKLPITIIAVGFGAVIYLDQGELSFSALVSSCHERGGIEQIITTESMTGVGCQTADRFKSYQISYSKKRMPVQADQLIAFNGFDSEFESVF